MINLLHDMHMYTCQNILDNCFYDSALLLKQYGDNRGDSRPIFLGTPRPAVLEGKWKMEMTCFWSEEIQTYVHFCVTGTGVYTVNGPGFLTGFR